MEFVEFIIYFFVGVVSGVCGFLLTVKCDHKYKIIKESDYEEVGYYSGKKMNVGYIYHLQCEKCGNIKIKKRVY